MNQLSPAEAIGIAARYAAQLRELLMMNTEVADALREIEAKRALNESPAPELLPSSAAIDLRA